MSALVTRGYQAPSVASGGGAGGPSGVVEPFVLYDDDGVLASGVDLSGAGVVQVKAPGAAYANRVGDPPAPFEDGTYEYTFDATEVTSDWVLLKIEKAGYRTVIQRVNLNGATAAGVSTAIANATTTILDAIDGSGGGGSSVGYGEQRIEQNASAPIHFTLRDANDVRVTGASADLDNLATISINGGAAVAAAGTFTEIDAADQPGEYYYTPDEGEDSAVGTLVLYLTPDDGTYVSQSVLARVVGPTTVDNDAIAAAVGARTVEGSYTADDLQRLGASILAGPVADFTTGNLVFKSLNGAKIRATIITGPTGRGSVVIGDLT